MASGQRQDRAAWGSDDVSPRRGDPIDATSKFGSVVFSTEVKAGHPSEVQANLSPGQYVALAGNGEGPPKLRAAFTVTAAKAPASLPTAQATIRAIDFGFVGPKTLHNGELVGVENEGFLVHMNIALQVKNLKAAKQLVKLMLAGKEKQAGKFIIGALTLSGPVSHGAYQQLTITPSRASTWRRASCQRRTNVNTRAWGC